MAEEIDYAAWDESLQRAIVALSASQATSRSQRFIQTFPNALSVFRKVLQDADLRIPLAPFQQHPTYLLRYLLAEWKDETAKVLRDNLDDIIRLSTARVRDSQDWRAGVGDCWQEWGYASMEEMYTKYRTDATLAAKVETWFPQGFSGLAQTGHPIHWEILPNTYDETLIRVSSIRRVVNNEHTLRVRIPLLNPPPRHAIISTTAANSNGLTTNQTDDSEPSAPYRDTQASGTTTTTATGSTPPSRAESDALSNPILGCVWIIDARRLSVLYASQLYKTATQLIASSAKVTGAHYPEQGYAAHVLNLGTVLGNLYLLAMRVMPASTQASTRCYVGSDVLSRVVPSGKAGSDERVPLMMRDRRVLRFTDEERVKQDKEGDAAPYHMA